MSLLDKVVTGKIKKPFLGCIYGPSGIGKTTFAASAPKPLFIATEEGTNEMDVARIQVNEWDDVKGIVTELISSNTEYESIVIDSLDHLEQIIFKQVALDHEKENIEDIGYAKGYIYALDYWSKLMTGLKAVRDKHKKNIILISHAHVKTFTDPHHNETYDRYELKMHKKASELIKETVDVLLFAKKDIAFKKEKGSNKSQAFDQDKHVLYTELDASFDAKNRFGLPKEIAFPAHGAFGLLMSKIEKSHGETPQILLAQIKESIKLVDKETATKAWEYACKNELNGVALKETLVRLQTIAQ